MLLLKRVYSIWCVFWLIISFLSCYPFFLIGIIHPKTYPIAHYTNKLWGVLTFTLCGLFWIKKRKNKIKTIEPVIYCANHTSYVDIPLLFLTIPGVFTVVGKYELTKVPLFGIVFRKVYIAVNRRSLRSKHETFLRSFEAIDKGTSIAFFPEGTIPDSKQAPKMNTFKDGPFIIAIKKQIPIVPVTIPYNWIILPDNNKFLATWHWTKAVFHEPINTKGMNDEDVPMLKQKVYDIINEELIKHKVL